MAGCWNCANWRNPRCFATGAACGFNGGMQEIHCGIEETVAATRRHPAFLVDGLDALRAKAEAAGLRTETDRQLPGYRRFYIYDPFGNRLEFLERE